LLGRASEPTEDELNAFADFALQLRYPPNPIRNLDDSLNPTEENGRDVFFNVKTTGFASPEAGNVAMLTCSGCHELDPEIERFGTNTKMSFEGTEASQDMKVAHLRVVYQKVGMFGQKFRNKTPTYAEMGDQVAGFGYSHDGVVDTLRTFFSVNVFHVPDDRLDNLIHFLMTIPTGFAPIIGQQVTLNSKNPSMGTRLDLMINQALAHTQTEATHKVKCDLVVNGVIDGEVRSWLMKDDGQFHPDTQSGTVVSDTQLRALAVKPDNSLTYLCSPPGSGVRVALDRDEDNTLNGDDDLLAGKADTNVEAANPNAEPEFDQLLNAMRGGFYREAMQIVTESFPSFLAF